MEQKKQGTVVALGNFDGVHRGHQAIIGRAVDLAKELSLESVVYTFKQHPENVLSGMLVTPLITTNGQKKTIISSLGADRTVCAPFTRRLAGLTPEEFVRQVLIGQLGAAVVVCGFHYHFGQGGSGTAQSLAALCAEYGVRAEICEPVTDRGMVVSSSHIRTLIAGGRVAEAARYLTRPFEVREKVVYGKQLGRTIGAPTINQFFPETGVIPAFGVYVTDVLVGRRCYRGVTNVGVRPTVLGTGVNLETNLIGFEGDLYGKTVTVRFRDRIREERRFASLEALSAQIAEDREKAALWQENL